MSEIDLNGIVVSCKQELRKVTDFHSMSVAKAAFLGKDSTIAQELRRLGTYEPELRKIRGRELNDIRESLEQEFEICKERINAIELRNKLEQEKIDVTLPGHDVIRYGTEHPIIKTIIRLQGIFSSLGFTWMDGPDIEDDWHNFTALNIGEHHPARRMHDTFYLSDNELNGSKYLLRTHTSNVQIKCMSTRKPPFAIASVGMVYRADYDATHLPMFHQLEGLVLGTDITVANLKYTILSFLQRFFGRQSVNIRFRNSYFPFTEPSFEVDIMGPNNVWLEVLGCGMVHPKVLEMSGVDSKYQGFALGMGVERLVMLEGGIPDIRLLYS